MRYEHLYRRAVAAVLPMAMLGFAATPGIAASKSIDLDANSTNESVVSLDVLSSFPVKVRNKITNKAVGMAFSFGYPSAGPGGFYSQVASGTSKGVGAIWTWETTRQVFSFTGSTCADDICFNRTIPSSPALSRGPFSVPGRSLTSSGVTATNESLTSSLITFFSPPAELVRVESRVEQLAFGVNRYSYVVTNRTSAPIQFNWSPGPISCGEPLCGNGVREGEEECDGEDIGGATCEIGVLGGPVPVCTSECTLDYSPCFEECGNGVREGAEECDGEDFGTAHCEYGSLICTFDCIIDWSECYDEFSSARRAPLGEIPGGCDFPGADGRVDGNASRRTCFISLHPAKEVTSEIVVCGDGIPQGPQGCGAGGLGTQGSVNVFVPDTTITIGDLYLTAFHVEVLDGSDGRAQPGETVRLHVSLLNAGRRGLTNVQGRLSAVASDPDGDGTLDPIVIIQDQSPYPDIPAAPEIAGDCDSLPAALRPVRSLSAFEIVTPPNPIDVAYLLSLEVTGDLATEGIRTVTLPFVLGVGGPCDPASLTGDFDHLEGLLSPMGPLFPAENDAPLPLAQGSLPPNKTRPLKMRLSCGGVPLTDQNSDPPEIIALTRNGQPVDVRKLDLNDNANNNSPFFRFSASSGLWIYNMRTREIGRGDFVLTIKMPNGQPYRTAFSLN